MAANGDGGHNLPVPDPTVLTTALVDRAIAAFKEVMDARLAALEASDAAHREWLVARDDAMAALVDEKFRGVDQRLAERAARLDDALTAAKDSVSQQNVNNASAIAKVESATQKQIDALQTLMQTSNRSISDKIADLTARVDRGEGKSTGYSQGWGYLVGLIGVLAAAVALVARLVAGV